MAHEAERSGSAADADNATRQRLAAESPVSSLSDT